MDTAVVLPANAWADAIDFFHGCSGGSADAPNIIFLIDNSPNWSRASQHWPDNGGNQGQAELAAVSSTVNKIKSTRPANTRLALVRAYFRNPPPRANPRTGGATHPFGWTRTT